MDVTSALASFLPTARLETIKGATNVMASELNMTGLM